MTRRSTRLSLLAAALVVVLGSANGWASPQNTNGSPGPFSGGPARGRGPGGAGGPRGPMALLEPLRLAVSQLDLSDAQKEQIKAIAGAHAEEWKALLDREQQAQQALNTAIAAQQFDEVTIRQRSAELATVQADVAVARARVRAEAIQILTADQQAKLKGIESQLPRGRGRRG